jgi:hypothetical protein
MIEAIFRVVVSEDRNSTNEGPTTSNTMRIISPIETAPD